MRSPSVRCALALLGAAAITPAPAQTFIVSRPCNASRSTRVERDPVTLTVGQGYTALGENSPTRRTHVFIEVDGEERWVALNCGRYTARVPALVGTDGGAGRNR